MEGLLEKALLCRRNKFADKFLFDWLELDLCFVCRGVHAKERRMYRRGC